MLLNNLNFFLFFWIKLIFVKSDSDDVCNGLEELTQRIKIRKMLAVDVEKLHYELKIDGLIDLDSFSSDLSNLNRNTGLNRALITEDRKSDEIAIVFNGIDEQYLYFNDGDVNKKDALRSTSLQRSRNTITYCHFNFLYRVRVCFEILNDEVTMYEFTVTASGKSRPVRPISLAKYINVNLNKSISFVNPNDEDILLFFHQYNWIYELNLKEHNSKTYALKTYQLLVNNGWDFKRFLFADSVGIITEFSNAADPSIVRQYYSIKSETSGLKSYCVHQGEFNGTFAIFADLVDRVQQSSYSEALTSVQNSLKSYGKMTTSLSILYICATIYFLIFIFYQFTPAKKRFITNDLLSMEREVTRLSPVIEPVVIGVHEFMNGELLKEGLKVKKDN